MVLIFSIWWDSGGFMNWLDSGSSGPCNATEGNPTVITSIVPDPVVTVRIHFLRFHPLATCSHSRFQFRTPLQNSGEPKLIIPLVEQYKIWRDWLHHFGLFLRQ